MLHNRERFLMLQKNKINKYTITLLGFIVASLASTNLSKANEMKPLGSILNQEESASMLVYAFERCSGLFTVMYARFSNYSGEQYQQIAGIMLEQGSTATLGALLAAENAGLNLTAEKSMEKSLNFSKRYSAMMDLHMENTGNSISPFIENDQALCIELNKLLPK